MLRDQAEYSLRPWLVFGGLVAAAVLLPTFVMSILGTVAFSREVQEPTEISTNPLFLTPSISSLASPTSAYFAVSLVTTMGSKPLPITIPLFTVTLDHQPETFSITAFVNVQMDNGIDYAVRGGTFNANGASKTLGTMVATQNANLGGVVCTDASTFTLTASGFPIISGNTAQFGLTIASVGASGSFSTSTDFNIRARIVLLDPQGDAVDLVTFP